MNRHLVAIKVSVKGRTHQWVKLNRFAFNQDRLERLNTKTVQCRRAVQKKRMFADNFVKNIPNFGTLFFAKFLACLTVEDMPFASSRE